MTEYRVHWQACPHRDNLSRVLFVEAQDEEGARWVARDHIERTTGIAWLTIHTAEPYTRPNSGRVLA